MNDLSGQTIKDRYTLVRHLGGGGFGDVYEAGDAMFPEVKRTVKIDKSEDSELRFKKEARLIALSAHPAVVKVIDYGTATLAGINRGFLVMEYLEGETLESHLQGIPRSDIESRLKLADLLVEELGAAIGHIHSKGVVHRDLKPSNIFIENRVVGGEMSRSLKLIDFGTTRHFDISKTLGRVDIGISYPYSPPEVFDQDDDQNFADEAPDGFVSKENRWDIYSFGAILYEVLSGHQLYDDTGTASPPKITELIRRTETQIPKPLQDFSHIGEKLPAALNVLILKCLAKNPAQRPQTMRELVDEYQAIRAPARSAPIVPSRPSATRWSRALLFLIAACLFLPFVIIRYMPSHGQIPATPMLRTNPEAELHVVEGEAQNITISLHGLAEPGSAEPGVTIPKEKITVTVSPQGNGIDVEIKPAPTHENTFDVKLSVDLNFFAQEMPESFQVSVSAEVPSPATGEPLMLTKELHLKVAETGVWLPESDERGQSGYRFLPQRPYQRLGDLVFAKTLVLTGEPGTPTMEFLLVTAKDGVSDPFYMMRTKVSNELYSRYLAAEGTEDPTDDQSAKTDFSIENAFTFCRWLVGSRGTLPSVEQWLTAAGRDVEQKSSEGPCTLTGEDIDAYSEYRIYSVNEFDYAESPFGIRQMGINGDEVTRSFTWREPLDPSQCLSSALPDPQAITRDGSGRLHLDGVSKWCLNFWLIENNPDVKYHEMNANDFAMKIGIPSQQLYDEAFSASDNCTFRVVMLCENETGDPENW